MALGQYRLAGCYSSPLWRRMGTEAQKEQRPTREGEWQSGNSVPNIEQFELGFFDLVTSKQLGCELVVGCMETSVLSWRSQTSY